MTISRRAFLHSAALASVASKLPTVKGNGPRPQLEEFRYGDVQLAPESLPERQFRSTLATVLAINEDAMLKPFRLRAGLPSPGPSLGGWYDYVTPNRDTDAHTSHAGFCPGHAFGQWISAMSRAYAMDGDPLIKQKIGRLLEMYSPTITPDFYKNFRFPAYVYDKINVGLIDSYRLAGMSQAKGLFSRTTAAASQHIPDRPLSYNEQMAWRELNHDHLSTDFTYDESYTLPENLFLATRYGLGDYSSMATRYLLNSTWFDPLSRNENVLAGKHAYSYCNSLSSGMQAYLSNGDRKYLNAVTNGFRMVREQSFATGGWGPREMFGDPNTNFLYDSLQNTGHSFETPCGSYAHFKISRALLCLSGDAKYGDSIENVMFNTVLGARPLELDGNTFYYSNYRYFGQKTYHVDKWPCCAGTLPQVTADYRISTYFHDANGIYINLYIPSDLHFERPDGSVGALHQQGNYPLGEDVHVTVELSRSQPFEVHLRVPAWCDHYDIRVNGEQIEATADRGWAIVKRKWSSGDVIHLSFHMPLRTVAIDSRHPETVVLMRGPLVLFPLGEELPQLSTRDLLSAVQQVDREDTWVIDKPPFGRVLFRPFTSIGDEVYSTYIRAQLV